MTRRRTLSQHDLQALRSDNRSPRNAGHDAIQALHSHAVALGARCPARSGVSGRRTKFSPIPDLVRRLATVDIEVRSLERRLSRIEQARGLSSVEGGLLGKAGYNPDEPRDAWGRWTASGPGTAAPDRYGAFGGPAHGPLAPAIYRPGRHRPIFTPAAGGGEGEREDLEEDFLDPMGELRTELFNLAYRDLKAVDPVNPALEMLTPDPWVPSWRAVQSITDTLEAAKAARDMELNGEPPPDLWELGWGARGVQAERRRGRSLPDNFPTIDRFERGIAMSIKSINLNAPSYQRTVQLEARINYYVNKVAAFNGAVWAEREIAPAEIRWRSLELIVPQGSLITDREETIARCRFRAGRLGVGIIVIQY